MDEHDDSNSHSTLSFTLGGDACVEPGGSAMPGEGTISGGASGLLFRILKKQIVVQRRTKMPYAIDHMVDCPRKVSVVSIKKG
jgi:hypothetical protein